MILDHQLSKDWRGVCARCVPGRKVFHPADADVESAGEAKVRESEDQDTGWDGDADRCWAEQKCDRKKWAVKGLFGSFDMYNLYILDLGASISWLDAHIWFSKIRIQTQMHIYYLSIYICLYVCIFTYA